MMKRFAYNLALCYNRLAFWRKFSKTPKVKPQECELKAEQERKYLAIVKKLAVDDPAELKLVFLISESLDSVN